MGILCKRPAVTSSLRCVIVSVSSMLSARRPLSFPFGWRKSLYGSIITIAVLEGMVKLGLPVVEMIKFWVEKYVVKIEI